MRAVSIVGYKNSGKTTLTAVLAQSLEARGLVVSIIKHTHHELDLPNTDTGFFTAPGRTVAAVNEEQSAVFWNSYRTVRDLLPLLSADIVLIEGGKKHTWLPRILCLQEESETPLLHPELAIASYGQRLSDTLPHFDKDALDAPGALIRFDASDALNALTDLVLEKSFLLPGLNCGACGFADCAGLCEAIVAGNKCTDDCLAVPDTLSLTVNGETVGLNPFVARIMGGALEGMLSQLKGVTKGCKAQLTITL